MVIRFCKYKQEDFSTTILKESDTTRCIVPEKGWEVTIGALPYEVNGVHVNYDTGTIIVDLT